MIAWIEELAAYVFDFYVNIIARIHCEGGPFIGLLLFELSCFLFIYLFMSVFLLEES